MGTFITALTTGSNALTGQTLWDEVATLAPLILILFVFAFGMYEARKLLKGGSKGKLRF